MQIESIEYLAEIKNLIEERKWDDLHERIHNLPPQDIAEIIDNLDTKEAISFFLILPKDRQAEVFSQFDDDKQVDFLKRLDNEQLKPVLEELAPDDRVAVFELLSGKILQRALNLLSPEDRRETLTLLGYPENSVGRLMTPDYIAVKPFWTLHQTIEHIKQYGHDSETVNMIYVVADNWALMDDIPLHRIILSDENKTVADIMDRHFVAIDVYAKQEEAVKLMKHYDLIAIPVVDSEGILLGIVTIDDILDVIEEENTEDFTKFSGISAEPVKADYLVNLRDFPVKKIFKSRISWLVILFVLEAITGLILVKYEGLIRSNLALLAFLPIIVDAAGNAGTQSASLLIRAMNLGTVTRRDWFYLLGKEFLTATLLGLAIVTGVVIFGLLDNKTDLLLIGALAAFTSVLVGSLIGMIMPVVMEIIRKDPAEANALLITTLSDIAAAWIYLSLAHTLLA